MMIKDKCFDDKSEIYENIYYLFFLTYLVVINPKTILRDST